MRRITTPRVITKQIQELCKFVSEYEPMYVPVIAEPGKRINECFHNVDAYVEKHGGQSILGWSIWQRANVLIEAEAHAVWKSLIGEMVDVTPHSNNETAILFLVDNQIKYEEKCIPNIRKALTSSPLVAEFIKLFNERDQIVLRAEGGTYSLPVNMIRRMREIEQELNQQVGRNDPCPCQSGIKYKKCCGKFD